MNRLDRISLFETLKKELCDYSSIDIENGIMYYALDALGRTTGDYESTDALIISEVLKKYSMPTDIETIIEFFESLLDVDTKVENGIVFTSKYISDYIVESVIEANPWGESKYFIDPGCGGGIFLVSAAEMLHTRYGLSIDTIIEKYLFGIDIKEDNVRRCTLALRLLSAKHGGNYSNINCNVHHCDSLKTDWSSEFGVDKFTYIIGNPPYVNPHNMNHETIKFLKRTFQTTKTGVFNIFYAFIEHAIENLTEDGVLGYIVPNNFLTIKSAYNLRDLIQQQHTLYKILDFGENMVFKPVRTYNCILLLKKEKQSSFNYYVMEKCEDVESSLYDIVFNSMDIECLDTNSWKLVDDHTRRNLEKIENNMISIKPFIRTGIATLKDAVFMVECDEKGYFKLVGSEKNYIEDGLVKPIYKVPDLKLYDTIKEAERYIIFPYIKAQDGYTLISEDDFSSKYPLTYKVLLAYKDELDTRDKGRSNPQGWYAYGRTQGLNKYGRKLLFPTFSKNPKFMYTENEDALFCNGYGVFENDRYELGVLSKILNSAVMNYYVSNTSYSIEGGYYCYQKKYIERFSIPWLSEEQIDDINNLSGDALDHYLWNLYELDC
jgi:Type I restriction-modification system methyltransferase subunit